MHICGVYVHVCGGQKLISDIFLNHSPPYCLIQGSLLNLEFDNSAGLASQRTPGILLSLPLRCWDYNACCYAGVFYRFWGPRVLVASIVATEQYPFQYGPNLTSAVGFKAVLGNHIKGEPKLTN